MTRGSDTVHTSVVSDHLSPSIYNESTLTLEISIETASNRLPCQSTPALSNVTLVPGLRVQESQNLQLSRYLL